MSLLNLCLQLLSFKSLIFEHTLRPHTDPHTIRLVRDEHLTIDISSVAFMIRP